MSEQLVVQMQPPTAGIGGITDSDIWLSHKLRPMCSAKPLTEMLTSASGLLMMCVLLQLQIYSNCGCAPRQVRTEIVIHSELLN